MKIVNYTHLIENKGVKKHEENHKTNEITDFDRLVFINSEFFEYSICILSCDDLSALAGQRNPNFWSNAELVSSPLYGQLIKFKLKF